ncbi:MAG TPA: hypothetical protein VH277_07790, partial [Gemmatimonadaceae bacterium]|nr:hypothetical protein [Gemmatimonadaceae bacterium]
MRRRWLSVAALAASAACGTAVPGAAPNAAVPALAGVYDPARDLGPLFQDVQLSPIFEDSKTFVDARPRFAPNSIAAAYAGARRSSGFDLRAFVDRN